MKRLYILMLLAFGFASYSQNIYFPDPILKSKLVMSATTDITAKNAAGMNFSIDSNFDNEISVAEAALVYEINLNDYGLPGFQKIQKIKGLEYFTNLRKLYFDGNQVWEALDATVFPFLQLLSCGKNNIPGVNVSGMTNLKTLYVGSNPNLTFINLAGTVNLNSLQAPECKLSTIDLSESLNLSGINLQNNLLTTLNVSGIDVKNFNAQSNPLTSVVINNCPLLENINLMYNTQLTTLNVTNCPILKEIGVANSKLTAFDVSDLPSLQSANCSGMPLLTSMNLKNGSALTGLNITNTPNIQYICIDDLPAEEQLVQQRIISANLSNVSLNSYCNFEPGGINYNIVGSSKFSLNTDACDNTDIPVKNLKLNITNGTQSGIFVSNDAENYSISVSAGTHTITPVLENPTYYNVSPANATVTFPTQTSPQTQNFCVSTNGVHSDIDVNIIPMTAAVPGFDVTYKIIYRNIGNTVITNGNVVFNYDDSIFDYVTGTASSSLPPYVGTLNWIFLNLQPFEARNIFVTLNLNGPMETPAVNGDDVLTLNASSSILGLATDENLNDNTMTLQQTVVNAMDPNDKTCLEGTVVTPSMAGKYVHYLIRFENLGTAPAQNVVVKDMIDTTKFDINSLVSLDASHSFRTNISNPNKVEFIFENIQLPFDDANNDGYIVFKIKTKATLVTGDTFSNSASIYFDYNFPVVTEPAITMMQSLGTTEFGQDANFTIYPNPTNGQLYIDSKVRANLKSISIYNVLGQLVMIIPNAKGLQRVDVASLATGNYIMKIQSDKGNSAVKFIKQ